MIYLDVAVVRIGEYLARTPELRHVRAASAMISEAGRSERLKAILVSRGASLHTEAGEIDGVATITLDDKDIVPELVELVIGELRLALPSGSFTARWAEGESHAEAFADPPPASDTRRAFRAMAELPFAARCEVTGSDTAVGTVPDREKAEPRAASADVKERQANIGRRPKGEDPDGLQPPQEFDTLAKLGRVNRPTKNNPARRFKANHLALVAIDGDNIGALMKEDGLSAADKANLSKALKNATDSALVAATNRVIELLEPKKSPVLAHFVGGDDVLVSVPAPAVWPFVRTYLKTFSDEASPNGKVTASAGVVIAKTAFPFAQGRRLAEELQGRAKKRPNVPAMAWLDVTRNGVQVANAPAAWSLPELEDQTALIGECAELEQSTRFAIYEALEDLGDSDVEASQANAALGRLGRRHGSQTIRKLSELKPSTVRAVLSFSDWWL